jgi:predicted  nucleic acid-binding Zn-ribbon protein
MDQRDWFGQRLAQFQKYEIAAVERAAKAQEEVEKAKAELATAKERLEGIRNEIKYFEFQVEFYNRRLPQSIFRRKK